MCIRDRFRLTEKKLVTESITLEIGYDRENVDKGGYRGLTQTDRYGRIIPKAAHGTVRFDAPTNLGSTLINESAKLFERITNPCLLYTSDVYKRQVYRCIFP